jgi:hypothetical protein
VQPWKQKALISDKVKALVWQAIVEEGRLTWHQASKLYKISKSLVCHLVNEAYLHGGMLTKCFSPTSTTSVKLSGRTLAGPSSSWTNAPSICTCIQCMGRLFEENQLYSAPFQNSTSPSLPPSLSGILFLKFIAM